MTAYTSDGFFKHYRDQILDAKRNIKSLLIQEDIEFTENVNFIGFGYIEFESYVTCDFSIAIGNSNIDFRNAKLNIVELQNKGKLNLVRSKIKEIRQNDNQQETELSIFECNIGSIDFQNGTTKKIIINNTDLKSIQLHNINGDSFIVKNIDKARDLNDVKIINCNFFTIKFEKVSVNQEENEIHLLTDSSTIKFKDTEFKGKCNFSGKANTILNENSKFNRVTFIGDNSPYRIHHFDCREVNLVGNFDSIDIRHSKFSKLITNEILKTKLLNISSSSIERFIISNPNIQKLHIQKLHIENEEIEGGITQIGLLKYDNEIIETYCDGFGKKVLINKLNFNNCNLAKDKTLKFYGVEFYTLEFNSFLNYGNLLFTDIVIRKKTTLYGNQGFNVFNSDLGKTVLMNCDFKQSVVHFSSSKISDIFLAGVEFPEIKSENYRTISEINNYEQKRLCYTQLKKIYDSRGDSLNSTKFHKAELEAWEKELQLKEKEKSNSKIDNWLKKLKLKILNWIPLKLFLEYWNLKILNWISLKLFPEYWNLSKENLDHKKLIFSQYKKMYEGRGDTVKAIEYQGKELDVHRTILCKEGSQYLERLQLSLNKYSNNFGQSWHWAVCWIFGLGIIIYIFYCRNLGFTVGSGNSNEIETFKTLFSYFFEFINPIRKGEFIKLVGDEYIKVTNSARVIDFFWRIVITYLGYQLIQAFRKYSKKTS